MSRGSAVLLAVFLATSALSCTSPLGSGEWGPLRFIGHVRGSAPLRVLPPISDRTGNVYTLYGAIGLTETWAFVSRAAGGSSLACTLTRGDVYGAHGWVGFTENRAWYWSGDLLVDVPAQGECKAVLPRDRGTDVELRFRAVVPWVRTTGSGPTAVALVEGPSDSVPYSALVDLERGIMTQVRALDFGDASSVSVLGVGADPASLTGAVLVASEDARGARTMRALFFDADATLTATASVAGAPLPEYGVLGTLQFSAGGSVMGLTRLGSIVAFTRAGGSVRELDDAMVPMGLHRFEDKLWLVGMSGDRPVIRGLDDAGAPGPVVFWEASERADFALRSLEVSDDRSFPARQTTWPNASSAFGPSSLVSADSPWPHAPGTTLSAVAGPSFSFNGMTMTALAVGPVGISYP